MRLNARRIFLLISVFGLIQLASCKKDQAIKPDEECGCIPIPAYPFTGTGYNYNNIIPWYQTPCFNPNDENEILYSKIENGIKTMHTYNLLTKSDKKIYTGSVYYNPSWGKNNWIVFNRSDLNIWKIKSNGDSLTNVSNTSGSYYPKWDFEASKFIYSTNNFVNPTITESIDGTIIDTVNFKIGIFSAWNNDSLLVNLGDYEIYTYNFNQSTSKSIFSFNEYSHKFGVTFLNDEIYFSTEEGIFKINCDGSSLSIIKKSCNSRLYYYPTINKNGTKLIFQRVDKKLVDEGTVSVSMNLVEMKLDGSEEKTLTFE